MPSTAPRSVPRRRPIVAESFSIPRSHCAVVSDPDLRNEVHAHTGNDEETSSILRSIERFGGDISIGHYEVTPAPTRRTYHGGNTLAWTVRAVRYEP